MLSAHRAIRRGQEFLVNGQTPAVHSVQENQTKVTFFAIGAAGDADGISQLIRQPGRNAHAALVPVHGASKAVA
jgi:hypothetical protein